jgi:carbon storage regulator
MLVLSRQRDETIMIGDDIEITVVDIRGDKVRLGINAPTSIAVHRKEVYEAIKAENRRAAQINHADLSAVRSALAGRTGGAGLVPDARGGRSNGAMRPPIAGSIPVSTPQAAPTEKTA